MRWALLIMLLGGLSTATPATPSQCASLDACMAELRSLALRPDVDDDRMGKDETELLARVLAFEGAVPILVAMLADADVRIASMAAKGLRNASDIDPAYLPQIIAGLDRNLGWLSPALGHMPSDEAAREAVARLLVSESAPHNQEAFAVERAGRRAIPHIVEAARCRKPCGEMDHYYLGYVLGEMEGKDRALAAPDLVAIAEDRAVSDEIARGVLSMFEYLSVQGLPMEDRLLALRDSRPTLALAVDGALVGIGSTRTGAIFSERLTEHPDLLALRDLSQSGAAGKTAGPVLVKLLRNPDWDVRLGAARAIGYVGYGEGVQALIPLLEEPSDVRLNWAATQSLGRLRATAAEGALRRVAETHWFPAVREEAKAALASIERGTPYARSQGNFAFEFFDYQSMGEDVPACRKPVLRAVEESSDRKLYAERDAKRIAELGYATTIVSYGAADEDEQKAAGKTVIAVTANNMLEHRQVVPQTPGVALRVDDGWLVGADRGEWGGELAHIGDDGGNQTFFDTNVEDIYRLGSRLVAVTGLAHMTMNEGMVYELVRDGRGKWSARTWRALPGAPASSWLVSTGELHVNLAGGGSILIAPDGAMRMAPCRESEPKRVR